MADFKKLLVWQKAHALAVNTAKIGGKMRGPVHSALRSQLVRASMSIDANISEGRAQKSEREFLRYLNIAINSACEVEAHLLMARDTEALSKGDCLMLLEQTVEVRRMLYGLAKRLQASIDSAKAASLAAPS